MIDSEHPKLSIQRQCELLGLSRSSYYYQVQGEDAYNLELMRLIDEQYTKRPLVGIRRMTDHLRRQGHVVNHKRVQRLMRLMGLEAIYPKLQTSQAHAEHRKYPYLLRGLVIDRPDQVWCSDVTYIRLVGGFVRGYYIRYLAAVIDWYSRYVLTWRLSAVYRRAATRSMPASASRLWKRRSRRGSRRSSTLIRACSLHLRGSPPC